MRSQLPSAYALELALEPELVKRRADGVIRPGKWNGYEKGTRVPHRMRGKKFAVDVAQALFPGTAEYFESPIWAILKGKKLTATETEGLLRKLDDRVVTTLFEATVREHQLLPRLADFDRDAATQLANIATFDALVAAMLLVARSEAIASAELRDLAFTSYQEMQLGLFQQPELAPFIRELIWLIDTTCKHWIFVTTQSRMEVVVFTQDAPERYSKEVVWESDASD